MNGTASKQADSIRDFLLHHVEAPNVATLAAAKFGISRQAVNQHLCNLADEGLIHAAGNTKGSSYRLVSQVLLSASYRLTPQLEEGRIWSEDVAPLLNTLPKNVFNIWNWCFTEMFNNAIDHSEGSEVSVYLECDAIDTLLTLYDNGVGIFRKIQRAMALTNERQAVLELAKGKFTTDRGRHSGLGIFFSSRMLDSFDILSGSVYFTHEAGRKHDWALEDTEPSSGTTLFMKLSNRSTRTTTGTFDEFGDGRPLNFNKTVVPVALAQYGNERLISRSQAKQVLARVEQFEHVVFDFSDVEMLGQGFADEIFRVFATANPKVRLKAIHANREVHEMIQAVQKEAQLQHKAARRAH